MCVCVAGEGGYSEVHRDTDITNGSSGLCELQRDSTGCFPHHHLDDWTQELRRQKGIVSQTRTQHNTSSCNRPLLFLRDVIKLYNIDLKQVRLTVESGCYNKSRRSVWYHRFEKQLLHCFTSRTRNLHGKKIVWSVEYPFHSCRDGFNFRPSSLLAALAVLFQ